jgi:hypothetical protein
MAIPLVEGLMFDFFGPPGAARLILVGVVAIAFLSLFLLLSMERRRAHEA